MAIDCSTRTDNLRTGKVGGYTWQRNWMPERVFCYYDSRDVMQFTFGQTWPMFSFLIVEEEWGRLPESEKDIWKAGAGKTGPWGKNLFMKKYWADHKEEVEEAGKALALAPGVIFGGGKRRRCKTTLQKMS